MMKTILALLLSLLAAPLAAAERNFMVTDFDRIRVEGPLRVTVTTGGAATARAEGDARALDALVLRVDDRTLVVQMGEGGWGGYPGEVPPAPSIRLSAPSLVSATVTGGGIVEIARMKGQSIDLTLAGSGRLSASAIEADNLVANLLGSGQLILAGRALTAAITSRGAGSIEAQALAVNDLTVTSESAGEAKVSAERSVRVMSLGAGPVSVAGNAACTVLASSGGPVSCRQ